MNYVHIGNGQMLPLAEVVAILNLEANQSVCTAWRDIPAEAKSCIVGSKQQHWFSPISALTLYKRIQNPFRAENGDSV